MKSLAVIPARGGSKGIRHKNMKLLAGNPLIYYSLRNALQSGSFDDIVVTTDDEEIISYVEITFPEVSIRRRPDELGQDAVTLDPVVYDACVYMEEAKGVTYEVVATLQPTSPTLRWQTLRNALEHFKQGTVDTLLSVTDATHLEWVEKDGTLCPAYTKRVNRQWLPKKSRETGAFLITHRRFVRADSRFGEKVSVFHVDESEAIDIDSVIDWITVQAILERKRFLIILAGNETIGMGHIYRMLTISEHLMGHEVRFFLVDSSDEARDLLCDEGWQVNRGSTADIDKVINDYKPDIVINDFLDTSEEHVQQLLDKGVFVVNFEDLGEGARKAHLVVNALYESTYPPPNHLFGSRYVCLNRRFLLAPPASFRDRVSTLLVTFGGVDLNNVTERVLSVLPEVFKETTLAQAILVLGPAYAHKESFYRKLEQVQKNMPDKIQVLEHVKNMAVLMRQSDISVTSNGRTVYELASLGVPAISIAQNDRETLHLFARYNPGIRYLGIACTVTDEMISRELIEIANNTPLRRKMSDSLLSAGIRGGMERVMQEILQSYWRWQHGEYNPGK